LAIFCSSCVGKLTKIDLEKSFEILNAILQFDSFFLFGRFLEVLKYSLKLKAVLMWVMIYDWMRI